MNSSFYIFTILLLIFSSLITVAYPQVSEMSPEMTSTINEAVDQAFKNVSKNEVIAVLHIQTASNDSRIFLLDELQHILVQRGFKVADRSDLDRIRAERDFQYSYEVDDKTAVSVGKYVGANLVVTGSISGADTQRRLRLKVINTETSIIQGTASVIVKTTQPSPFTLKVFGGYGLSTARENVNVMDTESADGFFVGISCDIKMGKSMVMMEPGVKYNYKEICLKVYDYEQIIGSYNYFELFAKVKLNILDRSVVAIQPYLGYSASFLLSASNNYEGQDSDIYEQCNALLHMGLVGVDFVIKDVFVIGAEYGLGLSNIWKDGLTEIKINTVGLNIGFRW